MADKIIIDMNEAVKAAKESNLNVLRDAAIATDNALQGFNLCDRCDGTGNELFFMYRSCSKCGGTGRVRNG